MPRRDAGLGDAVGAGAAGRSFQQPGGARGSWALPRSGTPTGLAPARRATEARQAIREPARIADGLESCPAARAGGGAAGGSGGGGGDEPGTLVTGVLGRERRRCLRAARVSLQTLLDQGGVEAASAARLSAAADRYPASPGQRDTGMVCLARAGERRRAPIGKKRRPFEQRAGPAGNCASAIG